MSERFTMHGAIDTATQKPLEGPAVEPYYDRVHQAAWLTRTSGLWAGIGVGGGLGAAIGAAASFIPYAFGGGGLPLTAAVATSAALGAGFGTAMGMVIFPDVAVTSAAVAAGFEERERREKLAKIREVNPELAEAIEQKAKDATPPEKRHSLVRRVWDLVVGGYNAKVGIAGAVLGALVGAVLAANPATATGFLTPLGYTAGSGVAMAASAAIIGMVGACFGLKMSAISNVATNFSFQVLSGKIFDRAPSTSPETAREQAAVLSGPKPESVEQMAHAIGVPQFKKMSSYQELITIQAQDVGKVPTLH